LDNLVDDVQSRSSAAVACVRTQLVLLRFEVGRYGLATGGRSLRLWRVLLGGLLGRPRPLVEGAPRLVVHRRRWGRRLERGGLSMLALRGREQLRDTLVHFRELGDELSDPCGKQLVLSAQALQLTSLQLAHPRVEIIFGSPCRSPSGPFSRSGAPVPA